MVADIAKKCGYKEIAFLDDDDSIQRCGCYPVLGKSNDAIFYDAEVIIAIGNAFIRQSVYEKLENMKKTIPTLIHPNAVIGENVKIGKGTVVAAGAIINPDTIIGNGCIINTCSSVDHDCEIGDFAHISVGAHLAGTVKIGLRTWIGIGAVINNNVEVINDCMVGAGAVVVKNIMEKGTYIGVPAKRLK